MLVAVALFHPAVDFEERGIIGGAFDPGHDAGFVIEFDGSRPHLVPDACTLDTGGEIIAHLALIGGGQFTTEESGHIIGPNGMDSGVGNGFVEWLKFGLFVKDDVGGEFHLHEAPVITGAKA